MGKTFETCMIVSIRPKMPEDEWRNIIISEFIKPSPRKKIPWRTKVVGWNGTRFSKPWLIRKCFSDNTSEALVDIMSQMENFEDLFPGIAEAWRQALDGDSGTDGDSSHGE